MHMKLSQEHTLSLGLKAQYEENLELARKAGQQIKKEEDKNYFLSELKTIQM